MNWTRCPMCFPMELQHNPMGMSDIDVERERREEMLSELAAGTTSSEGDDDEEEFDVTPGPELEALLPYYKKVEDEALKIAKKYFEGSFIADGHVNKQKLFEYERNGHTYRCYVDIYNENDDEINVIEVKATTNSKYLLRYNKEGKPEGFVFSDVARRKKGGSKYCMFVKEGNFWRLNKTWLIFISKFINNIRIFFIFFCNFNILKFFFLFI